MLEYASRQSKQKIECLPTYGCGMQRTVCSRIPTDMLAINKACRLYSQDSSMFYAASLVLPSYRFFFGMGDVRSYKHVKVYSGSSRNKLNKHEFLDILKVQEIGVF